MTLICPRCGHGFVAEHARLTPRQVELLTFLETYAHEHGCAPSFREIADAFTYNSPATVYEHLTNLEKKGVIRRDFNRSRSITLLVRVDDLGQLRSVG